MGEGYVLVVAGGKTSEIAAELRLQAVLKLMFFPRFENDRQAVIIKMTFLHLTCRHTIKNGLQSLFV